MPQTLKLQISICAARTYVHWDGAMQWNPHESSIVPVPKLGSRYQIGDFRTNPRNEGQFYIVLSHSIPHCDVDTGYPNSIQITPWPTNSSKSHRFPGGSKHLKSENLGIKGYMD